MNGIGHWRDWPATAAFAVVTLVASGLVVVTGTLPYWVIAGGFIPLRFDGAALPTGVIGVSAWLTPLSATLLHGGWAHLLLNLAMLVFCGGQAERALGRWNVVALYLIGAYGAAAGQYMQGPHSPVPMIGASGAISALLAAYALLYGRSRARPAGPISANLVHAIWLMAAWVGINLLMGIAGLGGMTIAVGAHIGGFAVGLVLTRPLLLWRYRRA